MIINKNLHKLILEKDIIICLNGDLPPKEFLQNKRIIAADGAANKLMLMGIKPEIVIGDLDSYDKKLNLPTVMISDQNSTDFEKCLKYSKKTSTNSALICGINGGNLDHILNNVAIALNNNCSFYSPPILGIIITENSSKEIYLDINTKISIIGIKSIINSEGLKWELNDEELDFPFKSSCLNRSAKEKVIINCKKGKAMVLIYENNQIDHGLL